MKLFNKTLLVLFTGLLVFIIVPTSHGSSIKSKPPVLVIDRCPKFCPPGIKGPIRPPIQICTQALIPVPGKPGHWYTNGCKKNIIKIERR
jgi:hypothetical protein